MKSGGHGWSQVGEYNVAAGTTWRFWDAGDRQAILNLNTG